MRLRAPNVRWNALGHRLRAARLELGVALDAPRERFCQLQAELSKDLAQLLGHVIVADEDCAHDAGLDHASLGEVTVAREHDPALGGRLANELSVADPRVVRRVVSQCAQPSRQPPHIAVGKKPGLHPCNLRIGRIEDLMSRLRAEAGGCYSWSNGPGDLYGAHSHRYEKVLYCVDGSITFVLGDEGTRLELKSGDRMVLPAGTVHSAVVGPTGCTCIEGER